MNEQEKTAIQALKELAIEIQKGSPAHQLKKRLAVAKKQVSQVIQARK